jgi:hypothetical protein
LILGAEKAATDRLFCGSSRADSVGIIWASVCMDLWVGSSTISRLCVMTPFHAGSWDLQQFNVYEVPGTFTGSLQKRIANIGQ